MLYPTTADVLAFQFNAAEWESTTPLPDKERLTGELDVLLTRETIPLAVPVTDGAKLIDSVAYWPDAKVTRAPIPLVVKAWPETEICCNVRGLWPELENVASRLLVLPTATSPKLALVQSTLKIPGPSPGPCA